MSDNQNRLEVNIDAAVAQRLAEAATRLIGRGVVTASVAAERLHSLGVRLSGLSTVEIANSYPSAAERQQRYANRPDHTGCGGCLHYDNNPYLACAVHPLGPPGEVCGG